MKAFIKKRHLARTLTTIVVDFIHDFTDSKWKFLTLKHFSSKETEAHLLDLESPMVKKTQQYGVEKQQMNYLKKSKCEGDYCNTNEADYHFLSFGYLRDSLKILSIERDWSKEVRTKQESQEAVSKQISRNDD